ncbi:DUF4238 domain-containing protein [Brucella anthropi]|uniref:DUF4238 domain-containing protein n=1 Tax=Brucella anthropi TaxID=529 RepID=A0A6I0DLQ8_BRUAN|nr:DUF4238 domain-containing protein [Brucella anthropi]KAB2792992.1 DUF4238 domain-containing protein [Brucella anthropi]
MNSEPNASGENLSSGPNQHYLPRFLQKPFGIRPKRKEIWVFARGVAPEPKRLKEVGASEYFYSGPATDNARTLDDDITDIETPISRILAGIRAQPVGAVVNSTAAAEIVNHLVPRTAHVRVNMERGLRMMAHGMDTILGDDDRIQSLMGLNEDEPNAVFRNNLAEKLSEIEGIESLGLPVNLIERIAFVAAKENFATLAADTLPLLRDLFSSWLETTDGFVRETHNKTLAKISSSSPRLKLLEDLNWTVQSAQREGAILPDCAALAVDQSGQAAPAMFSDWKAVSAIILPVTPDKLLVGAATIYNVTQLLNFNDEAARCSHDFFLAPTINEYLTGLHKQLGERSVTLIEEGISGALEPYLTIVPKPRDEDAPIFPADLNNQSNEPWQYELSLIGCGDAENVQELSNAIQGIVTSLAQALPLQRLEGITITSNYREAVVTLDRGYEGASAPDSTPEEIGQGIARTMSVQRGGHWKERIILDARAAFALLAEESDTVEWGSYIFVRQLTEVAISEMIEHHLPGVWMKPISDPLHGFLYPSVHPAIFSYLASHISAGFSGPHHHVSVKRELFITALGEMKSTSFATRLEYRHHGDLDRLLGTVMPRISYALQFAADLLGHCAASGTDPYDADGELSAALADVGLQQWFPIFRDRLERLRMRFGRWESFDEFLALDVHVERLMWQLGMLPWRGPEGIRVEIPLGTDIDKLLENKSH